MQQEYRATEGIYFGNRAMEVDSKVKMYTSVCSIITYASDPCEYLNKAASEIESNYLI